MWWRQAAAVTVVGSSLLVPQCSCYVPSPAQQRGSGNIRGHRRTAHLRPATPRSRPATALNMAQRSKVQDILQRATAVALATGACFFGAVGTPLPAMAERMPLSEFRARSLDEQTGLEPGRMPDLMGAYKRLIETSVAEGGAEDDELLFAEESEEAEHSETVDDDAGLDFGGGEWTERSMEDMLSASADLAESRSSKNEPKLQSSALSSTAQTVLPQQQQQQQQRKRKADNIAVSTTIVVDRLQSLAAVEAVALPLEQQASTDFASADSDAMTAIDDRAGTLDSEAVQAAARLGFTWQQQPGATQPQPQRVEALKAPVKPAAVGTAGALSNDAEESAQHHAQALEHEHEHIHPGAQSLDYQRKQHLQQAWDKKVDKVLSPAAAQRENRQYSPLPESFEAELEEPWHYAPNLPDLDYLLPRLGAVGLISVGISIYQWRQARIASRGALPLQYDIDMIEHYFGLRPDRVIARAIDVASEGAALAAGAIFDIFLRATVARGAPKTYAAMEEYRAAELREAITRLGPAFIKLGQALSSRPDLVGESAMAELARLQDALPFFPNAVARESIRQELGAYPERVFDWMSADPVAAASLGQVYKARVGGLAVAVKVQRPGLVEKIALDCYVLRAVATALIHLPGVRIRTDLVSIVDEYASRLFEELDYATEARNMRKFQKLYGHLDGIYIPQVS